VRSINIVSAVMVEATAQSHWVARAVSFTRQTILAPEDTTEGLLWHFIPNTLGMLHFYRFARDDSQNPPPPVQRESLVLPKTV
jgi:hypothetical protein